MVVRVCRVLTILLLVAFPALADTAPPKNLHLVGDHWTAYDPPDPALFPEGATVHIIERGDTLWDLAQTFYGDPYLWPQLWEKNTYITDAHWIYPGDPLLVETEGVVEDVIDDVEIEIEDDGMIDIEDVEDLAPVALGTLSDIYCFGYLGHVDEQYPNEILAFEDSMTKYIDMAEVQSIGVTVDDVIYINGGTSTGLVAGEEYLVIDPGELIEHPVTGKVIGQHYDYRGRVTILCADETTATGMVTQACDGIHLGDRLKPIPQIPIPLATLSEFERHCEIPSNRANGYIVNAKDFRYALGEGSVVEVNVGYEDAIEPGDFLTVYRPNKIDGMPRLVLGEIGILTTEPHSATGKIVRMRYSMEVGDQVELK